MVSHEMYLLGSKRSSCPALLEYGNKQSRLVSAESVYDFSLSNPSMPAPDTVGDTFMECLSALPPISAHAYTNSEGSNETRDAIAASLNRRFGTCYTAKNLFLTYGTASALACCFKALTLSRETEFLVLAPFFPEYRHFIAGAGAKLTIVPAEQEHFQINFPVLEKSINANTQALVINSPNNPSGVCLKTETIEKLASLLLRKSSEYAHPIYLISDESYREIYYGEEPLPFLAKYYDSTIVCYSYSMSLSMPGERIGYLLIPDEVNKSERVYAAIAGAARSMGYVCAPSLIQHVIARCADVMPDLSVYRKNRKLLYEGLTKLGYRCVYPDGAFYLFVEAPNGSGDAFSDLAKHYHILVISGREFGCPGFVRISYCVDTAMIEQSLTIFETLMNAMHVTAD